MNFYVRFTTKALFILAILMCSSANTAPREIITITANKNDFPATYLNANTWLGMDIEIIEQMMSRANLDYKIVSLPFKRGLIEIQKGSVHIAPNLVKNHERSAYMRWIGPTRVTCIGLVVQEQDKDLVAETTDELIKIATKENKKIGYLDGASYSPSFDSRLRNDTDLNEILLFLPDSDQHRQMLQLGRILGYFADAFEMQQRLSDKSLAQFYEGLALHPYRIEDSCIGAYFGVSKRLDNERFNKLKTSFQLMKNDGDFAKVHVKWVGEKPGF